MRAHASINHESWLASDSATRHDLRYRPARTESPTVVSKMIKSTAIVKPQKEGEDAERVSVRAIQTTRRPRNVNKSAIENLFGKALEISFR